jgi:hypothetical protein
MVDFEHAHTALISSSTGYPKMDKRRIR